MEFHKSEFCNKKQHLYQRYKSEVVGASMSDRQAASAKLIDAVTHFLCDVEPKLRFSSTIQRVFSVNARADPMWNLATAARTFRHFENYALNLLTFPWKSEFWTVRVYSAFYKLHIEPNLTSPEMLFELMGYRFNADSANYETTDPPLTLQVWLRVCGVAFDFFVAAVECSICQNIFENAIVFGDLTVADVLRCRSMKSGNVDFFVQQLVVNSQRCFDNEMDCRQKYWRCANCSRENSISRKVCEMCRYDNVGYLVPQTIVQPKKIPENQAALHKVGHSTEDEHNRSILRLSSILPSNGSVNKRDAIDEHLQAGLYLRDSNHALLKTSTTELFSTNNQHHLGKPDVLCRDADSQISDRCQACSGTGQNCVRCCTALGSTNFDQSFSAIHQGKTVELSSQKLLKQSPFNTSHPVIAKSKNDSQIGSQAAAATDKASNLQDEIRFRACYNSSPVSKSSNGDRLLPWLCVKCTFVNKTESTMCLVCSSKRSDVRLENPGVHAPSVTREELNDSENTDKAGDFKSVKSTLWQCAWCTFANHPTNHTCKICQNIRHTRPTDTR